MKIIKISQDDITQVELLYYKYNALIELVEKFTNVNDIYTDIINRITATKYELELKKIEVLKKYLDIDKINNYTFNFNTGNLEYDEK